MNVVEVIYNWPAETFIQRHIQALRMVGMPLQIVARHRAASLQESASLGDQHETLSAQIMPNFNHLGWAGKVANLPFLLEKSARKASGLPISEKVLLGYFARLHPELIHFHDATLAAAMAWIPRTLGVPYTLSLRGSDIRILTLQAAQKEATRTALEGAAGVHAVCHALSRDAAQLLGHDLDVSVIYTTLPLQPALPAYAPLNHGPIHFISSGRFIWAKGFDQLLHAMRYLRDAGIPAKLTLVGAGPELEHLLYLRKTLGLETAVDLPGKLSYQQIQDLFCSAHAYIQSSVSEGLSNSLAEAMTNGLPVFATDVGGTSEAIDDGISGFLLPPFAPQDWATLLMKATDQTHMEHVRQAAYQKASDLFSAEHHAHAFVRFFEKALSAK